MTSLSALVVEDDYLLSIMIEDILTELGVAVVGPAMSLEDALPLAESAAMDFAMLDVNLGHGETSTPVAEKLRERGIPFAFLTGYGADGRPAGFEDAKLVSKPFTFDTLAAAVRELVELPQS